MAVGSGSPGPGAGCVVTEAHLVLESQIAHWRGFVERHRAISAFDVDEMEDHLREQIADLSASGLDDDVHSRGGDVLRTSAAALGSTGRCVSPYRDPTGPARRRGYTA